MIDITRSNSKILQKLIIKQKNKIKDIYFYRQLFLNINDNNYDL